MLLSALELWTVKQGSTLNEKVLYICIIVRRFPVWSGNSTWHNKRVNMVCCDTFTWRAQCMNFVALIPNCNIYNQYLIVCARRGIHWIIAPEEWHTCEVTVSSGWSCLPKPKLQGLNSCLHHSEQPMSIQINESVQFLFYSLHSHVHIHSFVQIDIHVCCPGRSYS